MLNFDDSSQSRREFLRGLTAAGALAALPPLVVSQAAEPIPRNGTSHLKLSLAAYSFSRVLPTRGTPEQIANAKFTLEKFIDFCAEQNLDGCELTGYYFPQTITEEYLNSLKERTFRLGLDISGTAIGNDFCKPKGPAWDKELEMTRQWIDYAAILGAPVIRIFAGNIPKDDKEDTARERCIEGINRSLEYAAKKGVFLALENHGGITDTPEQMLKIIHGVTPSPWFGVNFDGGNFRTADPYGDLAKIAPYAINAQLKVDLYPNGQHELADLGRVVDILRKANYRGYIVLEYEAMPDPFEAVPGHLKTLREIIGGG
jgi:sugar phosphate isomerase/epimerase